MLAQSAVLAALLAAAQPAQTATGIPLDAPWKVTIYDLARSKFHHPAWGWQHSERNYRIAIELAQGDGLRVDTDVLFAAAFLHDMSAFMPCKDAKLEHGECAAEQSGAILSSAGFPMAKLPAVQAAERGHMYYSSPGTQPEAIVLHDADSLDFLGDIGAARMISLTGESAESFARAVKTLRTFVRDIPPRLITKTAQRMGAQRAAELQRFLDALDAQTFDGQAM
ncbi:MAG TPA: HD domain-containing protein [Candidatus Cybelea sp.]|nr:HD domain-containing protein [Candidatus Cybelea sp.]